MFAYCSFMHHFTVHTWLESRRSTITIENQLHFFEYFYNKIIYMKNFCLGFVKALSTHQSSGFWHKCRKI